MDQQRLYQFISRIVETSPNHINAALALKQLREILEPQLSPPELDLFDRAVQGVTDSLPVMQSELKRAAESPENPESPEKIRVAAERAHQRHLQELADARNGRC